MSNQKKSTKARLIEAALDLFAQHGVTETTTKTVAEHAQVNEVTLFRHFGNKHGLLLAVMEDSAVFAQLGKALVAQASSQPDFSAFLQNYAQDSLLTLENVSQLVHSVIGEASQYPVENRLALGRGLTQTNRHIAQHLAQVMETNQVHSRFPAQKLASLVHGLVLGYFIIQSTSEGNALWEGKEDFVESLVQLFLHGATEPITAAKADTVADLPANLVRSILKRAKKLGRQEYALAYVLFAAGISAQEVINLEQSHYISASGQHILQINYGALRQVPLNQWVMGFRYGSGSSNPLTQWLKSRKDEQSALFINEQEKPLSEHELPGLWQTLTQDLLTPQGQSPTIEQARQTWCVEMLSKGMELENLSILSGLTITELQPFLTRAREKSALEQASRLDQKNSG